MSASLRSFLWQVSGSQQLTTVLSRRAHIDQGVTGLAQNREDLVTQRPDLCIRLRGMVGLWFVSRNFRGELAILGKPLHAPTVQETYILVPIVLENPQCPGSEPVVVMALQYNCRRVVYASIPKKPL